MKIGFRFGPWEKISLAALLLMAGMGGGGLRAQTIINTALIGWMDQYTLDAPHNFVGNEACVPTSSTNYLTYLQNIRPTLFGTSLSGATYADWTATDDNFVQLMGTTASQGTDYFMMVYTLQNYLNVTKGFTGVTFSGMFPFDFWNPPTYPKPGFITNGKPTVEFFETALASGSLVLTSIEYPDDGGGHELLVNGIDWDAGNLTGTLYFIDPLDPSLAYNGSTVLGAAKQTTGAIHLSGNILHMEYDQYGGRLPYTGSYGNTSITLVGAFAIAVPEPAETAGLVGLGVFAGLLILRRRK